MNLELVQMKRRSPFRSCFVTFAILPPRVTTAERRAMNIKSLGGEKYFLIMIKDYIIEWT